ncbi:MAG: BrnA antitoxin family protein [Rhodanobacter sp.]
MKKRPDPAMIDDENPEWTAADFARAKPASEVLPAIFGAARAAEMLKPRGRPRAEAPKVAISLRVAPDVLAAWKATGAGWQTRMAATLAAKAPHAKAR